MKNAWHIDALVSVCTKIVPLCLYQVGSHVFGGVGIKVSQCAH